MVFGPLTGDGDQTDRSLNKVVHKKHVLWFPKVINH